MDTEKTTLYKTYPRQKQVHLPRARLPKMKLEQALKTRVSGRDFSNAKISLRLMGSLLYYSAGLRPNSTHRHYPSAGALYPLELYLVSAHTVLPAGVYHYSVWGHCLEEISLSPSMDLTEYIAQPWIAHAGGLLVITSVFKRTTGKYGSRGIHYGHYESGHLAQNLYLVATSLGMACCGLGGFDETKLERLLSIRKTNETVLYPLAIGMKK